MDGLAEIKWLWIITLAFFGVIFFITGLQKIQDQQKEKPIPFFAGTGWQLFAMGLCMCIGALVISLLKLVNS